MPAIYLGYSLCFGPKAGPNPWRAAGLEWETSSPPPKHNFETMPVMDHEAYNYDEMEAHIAPLQEQFSSQAQQRLAAVFGMWIFLATEVLFFGGMFVSYAMYRVWYPEGFAAGSHHLDVVLGATDSVILLLSSFTMALAIGAARDRAKGATLAALAGTIFLAICFVVIEGYEWHTEIHDGLWPGLPEPAGAPSGFRLFFSFNFAMTGLHMLHVCIGIGLLSTLAISLGRQKIFTPNQNRVTVLGLYWHFVDTVWIFLFPLLYLIQRYAA